MTIKAKVPTWLLSAVIAAVAVAVAETSANRGDVHETMAKLNSGETSVMHAGLFFALVWIVSSLRIHRLRALWRVGFGLKAMRGPSGNLLPRGPKARAATGGSVSGAGTSGSLLPAALPLDGKKEARPLSMPMLDNFRS